MLAPLHLMPQIIRQVYAADGGLREHFANDYQSIGIYYAFRPLFRKVSVDQFNGDMKSAQDTITDIELRGQSLSMTQSSVAEGAKNIMNIVNDLKAEFGKMEADFKTETSVNKTQELHIRRRQEDLRAWKITLASQQKQLETWEAYVAKREKEGMGMGAQETDLATAKQSIQETKAGIERTLRFIQDVEASIALAQSQVAETKQAYKEQMAELAKNRADAMSSLREQADGFQRLFNTMDPQVSGVISPYQGKLSLVQAHLQHLQEIASKANPPTDPKQKNEWMKAIQQTSMQGSTYSRGGGMGAVFTYDPDYQSFVNHLNYGDFLNVANAMLRRFQSVQPIVDQLQENRAFALRTLAYVREFLSQT